MDPKTDFTNQVQRKELDSGIEGKMPAGRHRETFSLYWLEIVHSSRYDQLT